MGPYGIDLRMRIVEAHQNKEGSVSELAERFAVARNTVQNYVTLYRKTGSVAPRPHGGGVPPTIHEQGQQQLRALVEEMPDATEEELADALSRRHRVVVSRSTLGRTLQRMGITRKKNAPRGRTGQARRDRRARGLRGRGRDHPAGEARLHR